MKVQELVDYDRLIQVNGLKEVTTQSIYSSPNVYHSNGLFSEEIFGITSVERDYRCGYITLPIHVFNPTVAKTIIQRGGGIIKKVAYGEVRADVIDGVLTQNENGKICGLKDLYRVWDTINIRKTLSTTKVDSNLKILEKTPKRLLFTNKVLVIPPAMRDIGVRNGRSVKNELNTIYMSILGLKSVTAHTSSNVYQVYNKFQDDMIAIYDYIQKTIAGKNGFLQRKLLAKDTLWIARNVISAPKYDTDDPRIGIYRTGYPLLSVVSMFHPIVHFHIKQFLSYNNIYAIHPNKEEVKSEDIENIYDNKMIEDLMRIFSDNPGSRFRTLYLDPDNQKPIIFEAFDVKKNEKISRALTLTDVIYIACKQATEDAGRHVYTVRYPIGDYMGAFFTRVAVLSTTHTTHITFNGEDFPYYPIVDPDASHDIVSKSFADTLTPSNSRLNAIGGDYDGDTVKSIGIMSEEANEEAEKLMLSKIYNVKIQGDTMFPIDGASECLSGLYGLTRMD